MSGSVDRPGPSDDGSRTEGGLDNLPDDAPEDPRLDAALASYLEAQDRGNAPSRSDFLEHHADLAAGLGPLLEDLDRAAEAARCLGVEPLPAPGAQGSDADPTLPPGAAPAPRTGERLRYFGDYELVEEIARGGMGIVFRARQVSLNRSVALKMILADTFATAEELRRFHSEAEAAAALEHPGIVPIFEIGQHEGRHYYTMQLLEGGDLGTLMQRYRDEPLAMARMLAQVARAVHFGHQRGILHRDLKPSNIIFDTDGRPHVADFGLAKRIADVASPTRTGDLLGTPAYMAPEQASGRHREITTATDIWSLGAILYEVLAGRAPFRAATPLETLRRVVEDEPPSPARLRSGARVPRDLETIARKCLEKSPARRYVSAAALAEDLERFVRGEPITARAVGGFERAMKWARRRPAVASLVVVSVLAVLVCVSLLAFFLNSERDLRKQTQSLLTRARALGLAAASHEVEARTSDVTSLLLAREAARYAVTPATVQRLREALDAPPRRVASLPPNITSARYSADGRHLVAGGGNTLPGALQVFSATGRAVTQLQGDKRLTMATFSPGGDRLAAASVEHSLHIYTLHGRELAVARGHGERIAAIEYSPDGQHIVTASWDDTLRVWSSDGKPQAVMRLGDRPFHIAFAPDGQRIACSFAFDPPEAHVFSLPGKRLSVVRHDASVRRVEFSPDGSMLLTCSEDGTARLSDVTTPQARTVVELRGHTGALDWATFSPDGQRIATASKDATARIWDRREQQIAVLRGHEGRVSSVVFSPSGDRLLTHGEDGTARLWDAGGHELAIVDRGLGHSWPVRSPTAQFSPDGRHILIAGGGHGRIWDRGEPASRDARLATAPLGVPGAPTEVTSAAFSHDGEHVLIWSSPDRTARRIDVDGDETVILQGMAPEILPGRAVADQFILFVATPHDTLRTSGPAGWRDALVGHRGHVLAAAATENGDRIVTGSADGTARVWGHGGTPSIVLEGHEGAVLSVACTPAGSLVATASQDGSARLWEPTGRAIATLTGHGAAVVHVEIAASGEHVLTASEDGTARLWSASGDLLETARFSRAPLVVATLAEDDAGVERVLALASDGELLVATVGALSSTRRLAADATPIDAATFVAAGRRVLARSRDGVAILLEVDGEEIARSGPPEAVVTRAIALEDGVRIALGTQDGKVLVWTPATDRKELVWDHVEAPIVDLVATRNGRSVGVVPASGGDGSFTLREDGDVGSSGYVGGFASGQGEVFWTRGEDGARIVTSDDGVAFGWNLLGERIAELRGHDRPILDVAVSPDGEHLATASEDGTARLWRREGAPVATCEGHDGEVHRVTFAPDGGTIATAGGDGVARCFDLNGRELAILRGHEAAVRDVAFSPGGGLLATASRDATARIWSRDGRGIAVLRGHERELTSVAFSADGRRLLTTAWDDTARVWTATGELVAVLEHNRGTASEAVFSPDGLRALTCVRGHTIVWEATGDSAGSLVESIESPRGWSLSPGFTHDGRRLLIGSRDGSLYLHWIRPQDLLRLADERLTRDFLPEELRAHGPLLSESTRERVTGTPSRAERERAP